MVMTEAMACRTPVITGPNGSVPEVVDDGETGSILGSVEEVAAAIDRLGALEPGILPASSTATRPSTPQTGSHQPRHPLHHCAVAAVSTNRRRVRAVSRKSAAGRRLRSNGRGPRRKPAGISGRGRP